MKPRLTKNQQRVLGEAVAIWNGDGLWLCLDDPGAVRTAESLVRRRLLRRCRHRVVRDDNGEKAVGWMPSENGFELGADWTP